MKLTKTDIEDVVIIEPKVFSDERGFFMESFNKKAFEELTGENAEFVQDNHSKSGKGVLRGLHYQIKNTQGKLVRVTKGKVFDVAVDLRKNSPTFKKWVGVELSEENKKQLWIPKGFAHGFLTLTDEVEFLYKTTDYYSPEHERTLLWNDESIGIDWPNLNTELTISKKDAEGQKLTQAELFD